MRCCLLPVHLPQLHTSRHSSCPCTLHTCPNMALSLQRSLVNASSRLSSLNRSRRMTVVAQAGHINQSIKKDVDKVVDMLKVEEMPKKAVFCRCWKSAKFPYCDGAHAKHNKETGDNVGPLIVEKAE